MKNKNTKDCIRSKFKYIYASLYVLICSLLISGKPVYAQGFQGSIYDTGTKKMFKDILVVAQGILPVVVIVLIVIWEIMKRLSEDNEHPKFFKLQKGSVIGLIVGETIGTLIGIFGGYYGVSIDIK